VFSKRTPADLAPNALARARARIGEVPFDLTVSNPTVAGIPYPADLASMLAVEGVSRYEPDPRGHPAARRAVAREYRRHGVEADPSRVVLTASTSEAYGLLFKLLCDPGDEVLIPAPSYPLLHNLAALEGLRARRYRLDETRDWQPETLDPGLPARAVVAVHPNNPTGSPIEDDRRQRLLEECASAGRALIVDEVFLDYPLSPQARLASFAESGPGLTFTLGGLSKSAGLPQLKLAWIVVNGPEEHVERALERLDHVADSYLSVNTPVQSALPELLEAGVVIRQGILQRCRSNLERLLATTAGTPLSVLPPRAGWSAVLRFPRVVGEETLALRLLTKRGVAVHPGYFFDFAGEGYLVVSLLPEPAAFAEGVRRIVEETGDTRTEQKKGRRGGAPFSPDRGRRSQ